MSLIFFLSLIVVLLLSMQTGETTLRESTPIAKAVFDFLKTLGFNVKSYRVHTVMRKMAHVVVNILVIYPVYLFICQIVEKQRIGKAFIIGMVIAFLSEAVKIPISGRNFEFFDMMLNFLGIIIACITLFVFERYRYKK